MHGSIQHKRPHGGGQRTFRADAAPVLIGPGIARFRDPAHRARPLPPFPALVHEPVAVGPAPRGLPVRPLFADVGRRHVVMIECGPGTSLYGTGECCGPLERSGRTVTCWNTDCYGYDDKSPSLYQSHPWVLAVRRDGTTFGVMVETTYRCRITTARRITFECEGHSPGVIVIDGDSPQSVVKRLAELTGYMPMPPRWALGYQQCRYSYEPGARVREIAMEFRERRIPCDVIWMDIDYMDGFRCFTFDKVKFPDPARLNADLHELGFKTVYMIDPGIKVDAGYCVYADGREGGHFVRTNGDTRTSPGLADSATPSAGAEGDAERGEYHGAVWPGPCAFPDFTNCGAREWWAGLHMDFLATGIDGVWNDMNEPAVFDGPGKSMPETNLHDPDADLGGLGGHAPHSRYHNIYGMQMVRATRAGIEAARPQNRAFVLTRSNFLGGHRYAATWTGDNSSTWDHLRWSIPMALNLGLSGQPFSGPDIGGFIGEATPELFARWMGIGALLPFARAHSNKGTMDHEPWSFGEECEQVCRLALERRSRLMPYLYTVFHQAHTTGLPVVRPVFFADPADVRLRTVDTSFLLGSDLLVECGVTPGENSPRAHRPRGIWREFEPLGVSGYGLPRLLVRGGAIVPLGPVMQFTGEKPLDPLTLVVSPDESGRAAGVLYEDAGDGDAHLTGAFTLTRYAVDNGRISSSRVSGGSNAPARRVETIVLT